ncbi:MAG: hypothetical protein ACTSU7_00065 [Candidatus Heimdallarchaeaceae archaeon]
MMQELPFKKGDIIKVGVMNVGKNGDLFVKFKKSKFALFLKNPEGKAIQIGKQITVKVVKLFEKVGYVEIYNELKAQIKKSVALEPKTGVEE